MRAYQVFGWMSPEATARMLGVLEEHAPAFYAQALGAAAAAMKARPHYLLRQPAEKRAQAVRRALARVVANDVAEELLAIYFLDCRKELLVEWLDAVGLEHEEGALREDAPACPGQAALTAAVEKFRAGEGSEERELLLRAFAAQRAIDWPDLEAMLPVA